MFIKLPRWVATVIEKINVAWKVEYVEYNYQKPVRLVQAKAYAIIVIVISAVLKWLVTGRLKKLMKD